VPGTQGQAQANPWHHEVLGAGALGAAGRARGWGSALGARLQAHQVWAHLLGGPKSRCHLGPPLTPAHWGAAHPTTMPTKGSVGCTTMGAEWPLAVAMGFDLPASCMPEGAPVRQQ